MWKVLEGNGWEEKKIEVDPGMGGDGCDKACERSEI